MLSSSGADLNSWLDLHARRREQSIPTVSVLRGPVGLGIRAWSPPDASERARSAAEQFLFERLESLPQTAGKFSLNGTLNFPFGHKPAEVDFLARELRLALKLDGYFHFVSADSYRRDRRKDWELQRRGFLVLRFLAEDVVARMEEILDTILTAVAERQRPQSLKGPEA